MERMAERIPESDDQSLQHFLSNSPRDERPVIDTVAHDADGIFRNHPDTALYIDETGFVKKGNKSVAVHRQWIGQVGKVENSQCGVFAALGCRDHVTPIDFRLYLPRAWTDDRQRLQTLYGEDPDFLRSLNDMGELFLADVHKDQRM